MSAIPPLIPLSYDQLLVLERFKEATKAALTSADAACDKVVTAAFSLATAYGAVIALVAPEGDPNPLAIALPIVGFVAAAVMALVGYSSGVATSTTAGDLSEMMERVDSIVNSKRRWAQGGVVALALSVLTATLVLFQTYGSDDAASGASAQVELSPAGQRAVSAACGDAPALVEVQEATVDGDLLTLTGIEGCEAGITGVVIPLRTLISIATQRSSAG